MDTARRRHGTAGAVLAAGLLGIDIALGRKPKEEVPVVVDAPTEPTDIDTDGIRVDVDEVTSVIAPTPATQRPAGALDAPPPPRAAPVMTMRRSRLGALVLGASLALMAIPSAARADGVPITAPADVVTGPTDPAPIEPAEADAGPPPPSPADPARPISDPALIDDIAAATRSPGESRPTVAVEVLTDHDDAVAAEVTPLGGTVTGSVPGSVVQRRCRSRAPPRCCRSPRASTSSRPHVWSTSARSGSRRWASARRSPTASPG